MGYSRQGNRLTEPTTPAFEAYMDELEDRLLDSQIDDWYEARALEREGMVPPPVLELVEVEPQSLSQVRRLEVQKRADG